MFLWNAAFDAECSADGAGDVGNAARVYCGYDTVCEHHAVWHVSEHGKPDGGCCNCRRDGRTDANALYSGSGGNMGAGRAAGLGGRKTGSE